MKTYRSLTLKTVYPQLHNDKIKYGLSIKPITPEEAADTINNPYIEIEYLQPGTELQAGDRIIYMEQGLWYLISFLKRI
jgi:hypothetical protein